MEVVESPLNLAHQQSRKADRLLAAGKYEEAISCHGKAADLLKEAMKLTHCEQAHLSLELQRDSHVKQQRLIEERWKRAKREGRPRAARSSAAVELSPPASLQAGGGSAAPGPTRGRCAPADGEREYDTWLYLLKNKGAPPEPCPRGKALKDDKTRLEEQETAIADLRKMVDVLLAQNEKLTLENQRLKAENVRLKREPYADADFLEKSELWVLPQPAEDRKTKDIPIPHLPPLEMPTQDISLEDLPALELPEDIQQELQELLDRDKP
ncbi:hypothetical protein SKAU_G00144600 [Synaphobranchus kaupii]|uniref:Nuclear receptor-binding factor 2 n=1 Tax=Synaphobranchus kaupii TaxID=118154 RepID=A0A9Q1J3M4_SYNKA|nr:hypothetical protein SKAU_G00144600 [Synaphobranchus kaupii]